MDALEEVSWFWGNASGPTNIRAGISKLERA